jgi:addiction module HigA family antidote
MARGAAEIVASREPTHPGELLGGTVIPATGLRVSEVAERLRMSRQTLHAVLAKRSRVTPDMALRLGRMFGNSAAFWANMQTSHDLWQAGQRNAEVLASIERVTAA